MGPATVFRRCKIGVAKAQVLPVPVWAQPSTSRPARARGIAMEPGQTLADVMAFRDPLYRKYAGLIIDCPPGQELSRN